LLPIDGAKTKLVFKFFTARIASFHRKAPRSMAGVNFGGESFFAYQRQPQSGKRSVAHGVNRGFGLRPTK
jgi:hypothetical protein